MIELILAGGALLALPLLLGKKKKDDGDSPFTDSYSDASFTPGTSSPSKVENGFRIANQAVASAATAGMAAQQAAAAFKKNPTPANRVKADNAAKAAKKALEAANREKAKAAKQASQNATKAAKAAKKSAGKAPKQPPMKKVKPQKELTDKERKVIIGANDIFVKRGINVASDADFKNELLKVSKVKNPKVALKNLGFTPDEIKILMAAATILKKSLKNNG